MKQTIVIDTSVVAKWFLRTREEDLEKSYALYHQLQDGTIDILAPTFLLIELTNILLRKKQLPAKIVSQIIEKLKSSSLEFIEFDSYDIGEVIQLAGEFHLSTYDALYLLLAKQRKCKLVTNDNDLLKIKDICVSLNMLSG